MKYRALVATPDDDAYDEAALVRLAQDAVGKPVFLMFTQWLADVGGAGVGQDGVVVLFETDQALDGLYLVPAYENGALWGFGLVPAPLDAGVRAVEEVDE